MDDNAYNGPINPEETLPRAEVRSSADLARSGEIPGAEEPAEITTPEAVGDNSAVARRQAPLSLWERELFDWMQTIVSSLILVSLIFAFVARVIGVVGPSMQDTLFTNQKVLISNLFYTPKRGDIVVFTMKDIHLYVNLGPGEEDEPLIKRVIATEGQTVDINFGTGEVWVDDQLLDEPYIKESTNIPGSLAFPHTVPKGQVFVMGDNRNHSSDSRMIGPVDTRYILGRVLLRVWPLSDFGVVDAKGVSF